MLSFEPSVAPALPADQAPPPIDGRNGGTGADHFASLLDACSNATANAGATDGKNPAPRGGARAAQHTPTGGLPWFEQTGKDSAITSNLKDGTPGGKRVSGKSAAWDVAAKPPENENDATDPSVTAPTTQPVTTSGLQCLVPPAPATDATEAPEADETTEGAVPASSRRTATSLSNQLDVSAAEPGGHPTPQPSLRSAMAAAPSDVEAEASRPADPAAPSTNGSPKAVAQDDQASSRASAAVAWAAGVRAVRAMAGGSMSSQFHSSVTPPARAASANQPTPSVSGSSAIDGTATPTVIDGHAPAVTDTARTVEIADRGAQDVRLTRGVASKSPAPKSAALPETGAIAQSPVGGPATAVEQAGASVGTRPFGAKQEESRPASSSSFAFRASQAAGYAPVSATTFTAMATSATVAAPPGATLDPQLEPAVADQIVQGMRLQWTGASGDARITLKPEYLGEVTVSIRVEQGSVTATVDASSAEVRHWLEANETLLRQGLADQGLQLDRLQVRDEAPADTSRDGRGQDGSEQRDTTGGQQQGTPRRRSDAPAPAIFEVIV